MELEDLQLCPSVLGLKRVGESLPEVKKKSDVPILNKRGMPVRARKRNPLFYGNEMVDMDDRSGIIRSGMKLRMKSKRDVSVSQNITPKKNKSQSRLNMDTKSRNGRKLNRGISLQHDTKSNLPCKQVMKSQFENIKRVYSNIRRGRPRKDAITEPEVKFEDTVIKDEPLDSVEIMDESDIHNDIDSIKEETMSSEDQNLNYQNEFSDAGELCEHPNESIMSPVKFENNVDRSKNTDCHENAIAKDLETKLQNLLKLPKAYNWVCSEFFYSIVDKPVFQYSDNDFVICMKESFPALKDYNLTRTEWSIVRRFLGKPRRCSPLFYKEERLELNRRRSILRSLQLGKMEALRSIKDIPGKIPFLPSTGERVTAHLYENQNGLFTGTVESTDDASNLFKITLDINLKIKLIPDYDILFNDQLKCVSRDEIIHTIYRLSKTGSHKFAKKLIREFKAKEKKLCFAKQMNVTDLDLNSNLHISRHTSTVMRTTTSLSNVLCSGQMNTLPYIDQRTPTIATDALLLPNQPPHDYPKNNATYTNNYPADLIETVAQLKKLLQFKNIHIQKLREMNTDVERAILYERDLSDDFQTKYASTVITLEIINRNLLLIIKRLNSRLKKLIPKQILSSILTPVYLQDHSSNVAKDLVERKNQFLAEDFSKVVVEDNMLELISDLISLLLQIKSLTEYQYNDYEVDVLRKSIDEIKCKLGSNNRKVFENCVEIHMQHIQTSMVGSVSSFQSS